MPTSKNSPIKSWELAGEEELHCIKGVCLDIDDTLSTKGKLTAEAFNALWRLKDAGFAVVPVTGRPAGWCDHIARFWPVNAVVGENGAFVFYMEKGVRKRFDILGKKESADARIKLDDLKKEITKEFPKAKWASDQSYREYDLAIDICEDVPVWNESEVKKIMNFCKSYKAKCKLSSIHVNTWFGNYDKQRALKTWLKEKAALVLDDVLTLDQWLYVGDSPNDAPAFSFFKYSVGVANLIKFIDKLEFYPTWITQMESGEGFVEVVDKLLGINE